MSWRDQGGTLTLVHKTTQRRQPPRSARHGPTTASPPRALVCSCGCFLARAASPTLFFRVSEARSATQPQHPVSKPLARQRRNVWALKHAADWAGCRDARLGFLGPLPASPHSPFSPPASLPLLHSHSPHAPPHPPYNTNHSKPPAMADVGANDVGGGAGGGVAGGGGQARRVVDALGQVVRGRFTDFLQTFRVRVNVCGCGLVRARFGVKKTGSRRTGYGPLPDLFDAARSPPREGLKNQHSSSSSSSTKPHSLLTTPSRGPSHPPIL